MIIGNDIDTGMDIVLMVLLVPGGHSFTNDRHPDDLQFPIGRGTNASRLPHHSGKKM